MSVTDTRPRIAAVARWEPGTKERLREAALARFDTHGYDNTSVEEIADDAGVTERTFFRHFPDKEEVLFDEDDDLLAVLISGMHDPVADAPASIGEPLAVARAAIRRLATTFESDRTRHQQRARVLSSSPALVSRQLLKEQRWTAALTHELVAAGVGRRRAAAAAAVAGIGLQLAYAEWTGAAGTASLVTLVERYEAEVDRT
jgi:AcrR family transcriptional regulator